MGMLMMMKASGRKRRHLMLGLKLIYMGIADIIEQILLMLLAVRMLCVRGRRQQRS